jgi:hypothetical protein
MAVNKITEHTSSPGGRSDLADQPDPTDPTDQPGHYFNPDAYVSFNYQRPLGLRRMRTVESATIITRLIPTISRGRY